MDLIQLNVIKFDIVNIVLIPVQRYVAFAQVYAYIGHGLYLKLWLSGVVL